MTDMETRTTASKKADVATTNTPPKGGASAAVDSLVTMCEDRFTPVLGAANGAIDWPAFALGVRAACLKNPSLMSIIRERPAPLIQALSQCASLGLSPHPDLHHFYLVPFKGEITAIIGYRGYIELAMRSGCVEDVQAFVIYRDEVEGLRDRKLPLIDPASGEPNIHPDNRLLDGVSRTDEDIVGAIAVVRVVGRPRPQTRAMTRDEIEKRRRAGQGNTPAWKNWYAEQCCKTVIRSLLRSGRVPLGNQAARIRAAADAEEIRTVDATVTDQHKAALPHRVTQFEAEQEDAAIQFERRDLDPLPSEETVRSELLEDLWRAVDRVGVDPEQVGVILAEEFDGRELGDLSAAELRELIGKVAG